MNHRIHLRDKSFQSILELFKQRVVSKANSLSDFVKITIILNERRKFCGKFQISCDMLAGHGFFRGLHGQKQPKNYAGP